MRHGSKPRRLLPLLAAGILIIGALIALAIYTLIAMPYGEAVRLFKLAAEKGNPYAQSNLAYMYENGEGVPQDYEEAAALRDVIREKKNTLTEKVGDWQRKANEYAIVVDSEQIADTVTQWTGIPLERLEETETRRLLRMEEELHGRIIGQDGAIKVISRAIRRSRTGLRSGRRPIGSFIFLGPTGVGKSELARALAELMDLVELMPVPLDDAAPPSRNAKIGAIGSASQSMHEVIEVIWATSGAMNEHLAMSAYHRIDAILQDQPVNVEHERADSTYVIVEEYDTDEQYGFAFAKGEKTELREAINAALQELRDNGTYQEIYDSYFSAN